MNRWTKILPVQGEPSYNDKVLGRNCELFKDGPDPDIEDHVFLKRRRISRIY